MNNRKKGNSLFTNQLIQLIEKYIPKNNRSSILKLFEEKSIKEQINLLGNYILELKKIESDLITKAEYNLSYGNFDSLRLDITEEKHKKARPTPSHPFQSEKEVHFSEKKISKLEEFNKIEKFEADFNKIKKQYENLFTHFTFKSAPSLCSMNTNPTITHPIKKPLGAKHEKTIEDLNEAAMLNRAFKL